MTLEPDDFLPEVTDQAASRAPAATTQAPDEPQQLSFHERHEIYGSFWVDEIEFALPVKVIQEVVNEPDHFTPVPLAADHLIGLFNLRGAIVPVIDLRILLGMPEWTRTAPRKIAIIENGELCLGLLFDDTGGVVSSEGASRVNFGAGEDGEVDVVVDGVLKFDDGRRMVQVLDPYRILAIQNVPRVAKSTGEVSENSHLGQRLSAISFQLGHTVCALDLRYAQEIMDVPEIHQSQLAHGHILGNINLRGRTLPVVDFRGIIGNEAPYRPSPEALKSRKLLILNLPAGWIGLLVYSIDSIIPFFEGEVLPFAKVAIPRHDIVAGCLINDDDEIVILLDHEKLLNDADLNLAAQSCLEIYSTDTPEVSETEATWHVERHTYIVFSVEKKLALNIADVCEVINRPAKLLTPPYALEFVDGIINLRGELITLVNPRQLYGFPQQDEPGQKVLIFKHNDQKYGLVVDSIDEIQTVANQEILAVPAIKEEDTARVVSKDVTGCLAVKGDAYSEDLVMILNVESLVSRCVREGIA